MTIWLEKLGRRPWHCCLYKAIRVFFYFQWTYLPHLQIYIYKFTVYFFIYIQDTDRHVTTGQDDSHSPMTRSSHHYRYSQLTRTRSIKLTVWRIHSAGWTHINVVCTVSEAFMVSIWFYVKLGEFFSLTKPYHGTLARAPLSGWYIYEKYQALKGTSTWVLWFVPNSNQYFILWSGYVVFFWCEAPSIASV